MVMVAIGKNNKKISSPGNVMKKIIFVTQVKPTLIMPLKWRQQAVPLFIAFVVAGAPVAAQEAQPALEPAMEEVLVTGVRAAQASAVNQKREAVSISDMISAEDIGKLPDATISDSLQRVTGVQIRRTAGEGGLVKFARLGPGAYHFKRRKLFGR